MSTADREHSENFILRGLSYPRALLGGLIVLLATIITSFLVAGFHLFFKARWFSDALVVVWSRVSLWAVGVKVSVYGQENLPTPPPGHLYVFNHTSHFDILIMHGHLPSHFRFGAKVELMKIPVFGMAMLRAGALPIVRNDRNAVLEIYKSSIERVYRGESFALAPEGTRMDGKALGKFKRGPFIFAVDGQFAVVPIVIKGACKVLPKGALFPGAGRWHHPVELHILPPVATKGLKEQDVIGLRDKIYSQMKTVFDQSPEASS